MTSRYDDKTKALHDGIVGASGRIASAARRAAAGLGSANDLLNGSAAYIAKVRSEAWKIVDADIAALKSQGFDEEQIYDLTVATAFGEGWRRLQRGLTAHDEAKRKRHAS